MKRASQHADYLTSPAEYTNRFGRRNAQHHKQEVKLCMRCLRSAWETLETCTLMLNPLWNHFQEPDEHDDENTAASQMGPPHAEEQNMDEMSTRESLVDDEAIEDNTEGDENGASDGETLHDNDTDNDSDGSMGLNDTPMKKSLAADQVRPPDTHEDAQSNEPGEIWRDADEKAVVLMSQTQANIERANRDESYWQRAKQVPKAACSTRKNDRESADFAFWRLRHMEATFRQRSPDEPTANLAKLAREVDEVRMKLRDELHIKFRHEEASENHVMTEDTPVGGGSMTVEPAKQLITDITVDKAALHDVAQEQSTAKMQNDVDNVLYAHEPELTDHQRREYLKTTMSVKWRSENQKAEALNIRTSEQADVERLKNDPHFWRTAGLEAGADVTVSKGAEKEFWLSMKQAILCSQNNIPKAYWRFRDVKSKRKTWMNELYEQAIRDEERSARQQVPVPEDSADEGWTQRKHSGPTPTPTPAPEESESISSQKIVSVVTAPPGPQTEENDPYWLFLRYSNMFTWRTDRTYTELLKTRAQADLERLHSNKQDWAQVHQHLNRWNVPRENAEKTFWLLRKEESWRRSQCAHVLANQQIEAVEEARKAWRKELYEQATGVKGVVSGEPEEAEKARRVSVTGTNPQSSEHDTLCSEDQLELSEEDLLTFLGYHFQNTRRDPLQRNAVLATSAALAEERLRRSSLYWDNEFCETSWGSSASKGKEREFWRLSLAKLSKRCDQEYAEADKMVKDVEKARTEWRQELYQKAKADEVKSVSTEEGTSAQTSSRNEEKHTAPAPPNPSKSTLEPINLPTSSSSNTKAIHPKIESQLVIYGPNKPKPPTHVPQLHQKPEPKRELPCPQKRKRTNIIRDAEDAQGESDIPAPKRSCLAARDIRVRECVNSACGNMMRCDAVEEATEDSLGK